MSLFSRSFKELMRLCVELPDTTEPSINYVAGNIGTVQKLANGQLVAVPPERVMPEGQTPDRMAIAKVVRAHREQWLGRFVDCLSDDECPNEIKSVLPAFRDEARTNGCADDAPILRIIRHGVHLPYHLRSDAPLLGACVNEFSYMQGWSKFDDVIVEASNKKRDLLIVGGPWFLTDSRHKTNSQQLEMVANRGKALKLDSKIKLVRGSATLVALLYQSHEILTAERHSKDRYWARTDTVLASGSRRLCVRWDSDGALDCDKWDWDVAADGNLGCLALGVIALGR